MRENVTISYRGSTYELGQSPRGYGIWEIGAPRSQPLEQWPDTAQGWSAASARFTQLEAPGAIVSVSQRKEKDRATRASSRTMTIVAAAVLAAGVASGIAGLFPAYLWGASLARQAENLAPHLIYLTAWTAGAVLVLLGGTRQRAGALLALGTSIVTFGLFFADAGQAIASGARVAGAGLTLGLVGWLACTLGSVLAVRLRQPGLADGPGRLRDRRPGDGHRVAAIVSAVVAGLGAAIAFAPSWDRFTLRTQAGVLQTLTEGNAFANPAPVIAGDIAVMVAVVAVVVLAVMWRPSRLGAALLAGAVIPLAAQSISALIQLSHPASSAQFGISPPQAAQIGLTISSGPTFVFWVYCAFVVALALSCAQLILTPDAVTPDLSGAGGREGPQAASLAPASLAASTSADDGTQVSPA